MRLVWSSKLTVVPRLSLLLRHSIFGWCMVMDDAFAVVQCCIILHMLCCRLVEALVSLVLSYSLAFDCLATNRCSDGTHKTKISVDVMVARY
jgi:hypothetical protein